MSKVFFLAKMRWFPDKVIVLFKEVENDWYVVALEYFFIRKAPTLLYVRMPSEETKCKIIYCKNNKIYLLLIIIRKYISFVHEFSKVFISDREIYRFLDFS